MPRTTITHRTMWELAGLMQARIQLIRKVKESYQHQISNENDSQLNPSQTHPNLVCIMHASSKVGGWAGL